MKPEDTACHAGSTYYPCHEEHTGRGRCVRCGTVLDADLYRRAVLEPLLQQLWEEEQWERDVGERMQRGDDLRVAVWQARKKLAVATA